MADVYIVKLARKARKDLKRLPRSIILRLQAWVELVGHSGLTATRKIPGFHDEALKGKRVGQRSVRLNKAYRAIYIIKNNKTVQFVEIQEVNKHEY